jgi:hypothetical protein
MKTRQLIGFIGIVLILLGMIALFNGFAGFLQNESTPMEVLTVSMLVHIGWTVAFILPGIYIFRKFWMKIDGK